MRHVLSRHGGDPDTSSDHHARRDARRHPRCADRQHLSLHRIRTYRRRGVARCCGQIIRGAPMPESFAATDFRRRDARDKLRGRTRYTIDRYLPGMLHAAVLRASVPSARIVRLDVSKAARMPGVRAVVTAADAPGKIGIGIADHPLFARELVRYDGEPLAAVAADTLIQAQAALAAIEVEVELLPAVFTMAEAIAADAPLVHRDWHEHEILFAGWAREGNIAWEATVVRGDVDAAFARPDVVIVDSAFRVGRQNHVAFEPRAVVASYEDGRLHIETSTQVPWSIRNATARLLGGNTRRRDRRPRGRGPDGLRRLWR